MWSMKRMWRDKGLVLSSEYWVLRCFSRDIGERNKEQRRFLNGKSVWGDIEERLNSFQDSFERLFRTPYSLLTIHLIAVTLFLGSCNSDVKQSAENQQYTCSMHPQIVENEPGSCPICGMDLTPIRGQHQATHSVDSLLATGNNKNANTETIVVRESAYTPEIKLNGSITYNTNQVKSISARVSGRIEKSYVKYSFEPVKKGQLLLTVYSPELVAIQQEMLFLKSKNDIDLLNKTKTKLNLLGVSNQQINRILQSGKADYTINIYSNYSGYLLNPDANTEGNLQSANNPLNIKEGQYINSGDLLFKVFNDNILWVEFYTNALESNWLKKGTRITMDLGGKKLKTRIDLIQPFYKDDQNYKLIRVVINNQKQQHKIGELVTATAESSAIQGIWIPQQAVYQSGEKNLVFIKKNNTLQPTTVEVSAKAGSDVLVAKGLSKGDEIAKNASYLTDSESFIDIK